MNPYAWDELKRKWQHEELTPEQLFGQLLIWCQLTHELALGCQHQLDVQAQQLDELGERVERCERGAGE